MTDLVFVSWMLYNDRPGVCQLEVTQWQTWVLSAGSYTMTDLGFVSWVLHNIRHWSCQLGVTKCHCQLGVTQWQTFDSQPGVTQCHIIGSPVGCYTMKDFWIVRSVIHNDRPWVQCVNNNLEHCINTLRPRGYGRCSTDDISTRMFLNGNDAILLNVTDVCC